MLAQVVGSIIAGACLRDPSHLTAGPGPGQSLATAPEVPGARRALEVGCVLSPGAELGCSAAAFIPILPRCARFFSSFSVLAVSLGSLSSSVLSTRNCCLWKTSLKDVPCFFPKMGSVLLSGDRSSEKRGVRRLQRREFPALTLHGVWRSNSGMRRAIP